MPTLAPRFLFASDSLKGTISSVRTAELLGEAARATFPDCVCRSLAMADGGEGTVAAVVAACKGSLRKARVTGPLGDSVEAVWGLLPQGRAIIEMASASGLTLIPRDLRDPRLTSTSGTGELIRAALDAGARDIAIAIGGSATNDAGMGAMRELGVRFLDQSGAELAGRGEDLARVEGIDIGSLDRRLRKTNVTVMCDVDNPLCGPTGATAVFAPQKGADDACLVELEGGMEHYASVLAETIGRDVSSDPGSGAAGGLGSALSAFLEADLVSGIECVLDLVGFDRLLEWCDVCITGEGRLDEQTAHGKVVYGVARHCQKAGVPCVALVGSARDDARVQAREWGVRLTMACEDKGVPHKVALANAESLYLRAARNLFGMMSL